MRQRPPHTIPAGEDPRPPAGQIGLARAGKGSRIRGSDSAIPLNGQTSSL